MCVGLFVDRRSISWMERCRLSTGREVQVHWPLTRALKGARAGRCSASSLSSLRLRCWIHKGFNPPPCAGSLLNDAFAGVMCVIVQACDVQLLFAIFNFVDLHKHNDIIANATNPRYPAMHRTSEQSTTEQSTTCLPC